MHPIRPLALVALIAFTLSGCGEKPTYYQGVGFSIADETDGLYYYRVWTNEQPQEAGDSIWEGRLYTNNSVLGCADGQENLRSRGHYLDTIFVEFILYELEEFRGADSPGRELNYARWDGLVCHKPYTVVVESDLDLVLYPCACRMSPEEREGYEPIAPSAVRSA